MELITIITLIDFIQWFAVVLASLVSLLTLYNAAKLRSGVLAMATYAFGAGMLCLAAAFFLLAIPDLNSSLTVDWLYRILFVIGFSMLGLGSFKIYKMSQV
ncbi:hypothetical protein C4544_04560 [candidate division WS5 bacterium]|uniref:Uncharacterized protein n=1 Tax=candidate division WS5 bacterium TaxID=2093353 RepID=A0A419DC95_9BACT|nr:MAG: hypothetical protein C4544_04560 [candidate division WS5 bacterium]